MKTGWQIKRLGDVCRLMTGGTPSKAESTYFGGEIRWLVSGGYIHPYPDGNGRMARFLMNAMLASGGYPWTVIEAGKRRAYFSALDQASVGLHIQPLAKFIAMSIPR